MILTLKVRRLWLGEMKARVTQLEAAKPKLKLRHTRSQSPCLCAYFSGRNQLD